MHGLMRTRAFVQDDAHIFCRPVDVSAEVVRFIGLLRDVYAELGFDEVDVALSTRPAQRFGSDEDWDAAEAALDQAARACGFELKVQPGEGAFYGPKLEFALCDRLGRSWQCGTVQLDYVLPSRLGATYVEADGDRAVPVMIHHAVLGSMERMIAVLLEHHAGRLPIPLAPEQVAILPLSDEQGAYADDLASMLRSAGWRVRLLPPTETLSRRIVEARELRIPVLAVVGRREAKDGTVALRIGEGAQTAVPAGDLASRIAAVASADVGVVSVREVA
jgi:threonyl-tRNA synthetase